MPTELAARPVGWDPGDGQQEGLVHMGSFSLEIPDDILDEARIPPSERAIQGS